jgi:hypothetical protein
MAVQEAARVCADDDTESTDDTIVALHAGESMLGAANYGNKHSNPR